MSRTWTDKKITENQKLTLEALYEYRFNCWNTPMELGSVDKHNHGIWMDDYDTSHHSRTCQQLVNKGLCAKQRRYVKRGSGGSNLYMITDKGITLYKEMIPNMPYNINMFHEKKTKEILCIETFLSWKGYNHKTIHDPNKIMSLNSGKTDPIIETPTGEFIAAGFPNLYKWFQDQKIPRNIIFRT